MGKFFVEVVYDAEFNTIIEVRSFKTGHLLGKFYGSYFKLDNYGGNLFKAL